MTEPAGDEKKKRESSRVAVFQISWVGSGRVESGRGGSGFQISLIGPGHPDTLDTLQVSLQ